MRNLHHIKLHNVNIYNCTNIYLKIIEFSLPRNFTNVKQLKYKISTFGRDVSI